MLGCQNDKDKLYSIHYGYRSYSQSHAHRLSMMDYYKLWVKPYRGGLIRQIFEKVRVELYEPDLLLRQIKDPT